MEEHPNRPHYIQASQNDYLYNLKGSLILQFFQDKLKCFSGTPEVNAGRQILNVMRLDCPTVPKADHVQTAISHSITHALLSILIVLVAFLLIVLLVINRDRVRSNVKPLVVRFQKSMQYRTISREPEVTEVNVWTVTNVAKTKELLSWHAKFFMCRSR